MSFPSCLEIWALLRKVRSLSFDARSGAGSGWDGVGRGSVAVSEPANGVVVFQESGTWQPGASGRPAVRFTNVFRWSARSESIRLEHFRFGPENPVLLFDLALSDNGDWREISPHQCREDCYTATMAVEGERLLVRWSIQGPRKTGVNRVYLLIRCRVVSKPADSSLAAV